jgi:hypothetical protein
LGIIKRRQQQENARNGRSIEAIEVNALRSAPECADDARHSRMLGVGDGDAAANCRRTKLLAAD